MSPRQFLQKEPNCKAYDLATLLLYRMSQPKLGHYVILAAALTWGIVTLARSSRSCTSDDEPYFAPMEGQVQFLLTKAWRMYEHLPSDQRLILGVAGIPGSGKTTLAKILTDRLNAHSRSLHPDSPPPATFVPMDGFHLSRAELDQLPDPELAHARRGAAFTFNASKFLSLLRSLRASPPALIKAPSFDHALKDPRENDITVLPSHRIVIVEGLYLTLDRDIWREAAKMFDEVWFVDVDREVARKRLGARHLRAGIVKTLEEGDRRARENDLVNGDEIMAHRVRVDESVQSLEDDAWVHE